MRRLLQSRIAAWGAFVLVLVMIVLSLVMVPDWKDNLWTLSDEFFAFMMVFSQLVAVYIVRLNPAAGRKLQYGAAVFGVLMIISLIVEMVALN